MSEQDEKKEALKAALAKNVDKLMLVGLAVLAGFVALIRFGEISSVYIPPEKPSTKDPQVFLSSKEGLPTSANYFKVIGLSGQMPPFDQSPFVPLQEFNMFDAKAARDAEELKKRADELLAEAKRSLDAGRLDEAEAKIQEALKTSYRYKPALEMLEQVQTRKGGGDAAGAEGEVPASDAAAAPATPPAATPAPGGP